MEVSWNIAPEGVARAHGRPSQIAALGQSVLTVALPFRVLFPSLSIARRSVIDEVASLVEERPTAI